MRKILYIIPFFIFAFTFTGGPPSGWYQQFMPNLNGEAISDIYFIDSLTGFAVTGDDLPNDTNYILKTTNGGDNWTIKFSAYKDFFRVKFLNPNTGYVCGGFNAIGQGLVKTTDGGENWIVINSPASIYFEDMSALNEDTIWLVQGSSLDGGVFRTTNGGANWTQQLNLGSQNPTHVYFYNKDTGFAASTVLYKTTNSGLNWFQIPGGTGFGEMYLLMQLPGGNAMDQFRKQQTEDQTGRRFHSHQREGLLFFQE